MSSDFCVRCDNEFSVYCGKCVDAEREELDRLRRLVPTGTYTLNVAHEQEIQRLRDQADEWRLRAADYSNRMDEWKLKEGEARAKADQYERDWYEAKSEFGSAMAKMREALRAAEKRELEALAELDEARDLLQAVATACRGLGPRTDAVMSVVGNALAELDEERANVEMLKTHVETLREAWQGASEAVTKLGEQLNASESDCERFGKLLDDCRDELMGQYDPDSVNAMIHRIDDAIGLCEPVTP